LTQIFSYQAYDSKGNPISGNIEAENQQLVVRRLLSMGYTITAVTPKKEANREIQISSFYSNRVNIRDVAMFTRQMASMIAAGLPLVRVLNILERQTESRFLRKALSEIKKDVESGESLSIALGKFPKIFDRLYVHMVRAGEMTGALDEVLTKLARAIEKEIEFKGKVRNATAYPTMLLLFSFLAIGFLVVAVVPGFATTFQDMGVTLPLPTQILLQVGTGARQNIWFIIGALILLAVGLRLTIKTERGRNVYDRGVIRLPLIGRLIQKIETARFAGTLALLVSSGIPILSALEVVQDTAGNIVMGSAIAQAKSGIREGEVISRALDAAGSFDPMVVHMVSVGEETGTLGNILNHLSDFYEKEVNQTLATLMPLIEPLLIVFVAFIAGFVVISIMLPMFEIMGSIN